MSERMSSLTARGAEARSAARARHPTARAWAPGRERLLDRLATRARARGAAWPRVAAAVVLLRGIAGDDAPTFARRVGVTAAELARLERGAAPASALPARLRAVVGLVDWGWVDSGPGPLGDGPLGDGPLGDGPLGDGPPGGDPPRQGLR
jgi:hypothetical protein